MAGCTGAHGVDAACEQLPAGLDISALPGPVGGHYKKESSNFKELYAILRALQAIRDILKESHIQILSDNSTAVAYLNKQGDTRNKDFMDLSFKIFALAEDFFF